MNSTNETIIAESGTAQPIENTDSISNIISMTNKRLSKQAKESLKELEKRLKDFSKESDSDSKDSSQDFQEYIYTLFNGTTETESQRKARIDVAIETVLEIGSAQRDTGLSMIQYLSNAMKFRIFMHKFNNTNFAKHLGLVFSHDADMVKLCGHKVCQIEHFLCNYFSFFKLGGLDMFETFSEVRLTSDSIDSAKKARLVIDHQPVVFTILNLNGEMDSKDNYFHDIKIKFTMSSPVIRENWLNYNGIKHADERAVFQISLLDYLSYLNTMYMKTAEI